MLLKSSTLKKYRNGEKRMTINFEKDQVEVFDKTKNINRLADKIKELQAHQQQSEGNQSSNQTPQILNEPQMGTQYSSSKTHSQPSHHAHPTLWCSHMGSSSHKQQNNPSKDTNNPERNHKENHGRAPTHTIGNPHHTRRG